MFFFIFNFLSSHKGCQAPGLGSVSTLRLSLEGFQTQPLLNSKSESLKSSDPPAHRPLVQSVSLNRAEAASLRGDAAVYNVRICLQFIQMFKKIKNIYIYV